MAKKALKEALDVLDVEPKREPKEKEKSRWDRGNRLNPKNWAFALKDVGDRTCVTVNFAGRDVDAVVIQHKDLEFPIGS